MRSDELRASLAAVGPLLPVFTYQDRVVDGSKRQDLCAELGVSIAHKSLRNVKELCSTLWPLHPERALEEAIAAHNKRPALLELAELCGAQPVAIAVLLGRSKPAPTEPRLRRDRKLQAVKLQVYLEPYLKHLAERAAEELRVNLSELTRGALWEKIALTVPCAPLEPPRGVRARAIERVARFRSRRKDLE